MFNKTKSENKKWFCKSCIQCFSSEKILNEQGKDCLFINGGQRIKLEKDLLNLIILIKLFLVILKFMLILNVY